MLEVYFGLLITGWVVVGFLFIGVFWAKGLIEKFDLKVLVPVLKLVMGIGWLLDVLLNYWLSPLFTELPKSPLETVTMRMKRYKKTEKGYKLAFSTWLCRQLSKHDKGHC